MAGFNTRVERFYPLAVNRKRFLSLASCAQGQWREAEMVEAFSQGLGARRRDSRRGLGTESRRLVGFPACQLKFSTRTRSLPLWSCCP